MIETLFNYGGDAKSSQLSMAMFYKDTPGKMDVVDPVADNADANMGLKARYTFTCGHDGANPQRHFLPRPFNFERS